MSQHTWACRVCVLLFVVFSKISNPVTCQSSRGRLRRLISMFPIWLFLRHHFYPSIDHEDITERPLEAAGIYLFCCDLARKWTPWPPSHLFVGGGGVASTEWSRNYPWWLYLWYPLHPFGTRTTSRSAPFRMLQDLHSQDCHSTPGPKTILAGITQKQHTVHDVEQVFLAYLQVLIVSRSASDRSLLFTFCHPLPVSRGSPPDESDLEKFFPSVSTRLLANRNEPAPPIKPL